MDGSITTKSSFYSNVKLAEILGLKPETRNKSSQTADEKATKEFFPTVPVSTIHSWLSNARGNSKQFLKKTIEKDNKKSTTSEDARRVYLPVQHRKRVQELLQ